MNLEYDPNEQPEVILDSQAAHAHEVVAPQRSPLAMAGIGIMIAALGWFVVTSGTDGTSGDVALPPSTTARQAPTPPEPPPRPPLPPLADDPRVEGELRDGRAFEVYEASPGVLCVTFPEISSTELDTCHLELESASGAGVIEDFLVFGYLTAGAESASVRYRSGEPGNTGLRIEPIARFFALPLRFDDAYRLQYRDANFDVASEVPLVALRGGPSQSPEDAGRDNVPAEIAALSVAQRLSVSAEWTAFSEGPTVWSQQPTLLATQPGWGEIVLLDPTGTRIERSTPIPSVRLTAQLSRPDAHYFLGQQVATPNQMAVDRDEFRFPVALIRIDRDTGDHRIVLFPQASINDEPNIGPIAVRPNWEIGPQLPDIDESSIGGVDGEVQLRSTDGSSIQLDGVTLLPTQ